MNLAESIFLYLPVPYWAAFVLILYRHDLSRLSHPFRDNRSMRGWWLVLNHLGLIAKGWAAKKPRRKDILTYLAVLAISIAVSLSWVLRLIPPVWYYLAIVQGISAIVLTVSTMRYLGAPPRRPFVDVLRYPR